MKHVLEDQPTNCHYDLANCFIVVILSIEKDGVGKPCYTDHLVLFGLGSIGNVCGELIFVNRVMHGLSKPAKHVGHKGIEWGSLNELREPQDIAERNEVQLPHNSDVGD